MTQSLQVACVGAGYFSQFHLDAWARLDGVEVVGVADQNLEAAQRTGLAAFTDVAEMVSTTQPDVLDIILPPVAHAAVIGTALNSGVRHIVCQKPFCQSVAEAEQMVAAADAAGATLIVHENFRFMPWYRFIKTELDKGTIGTLHQATFRLRSGDGQGPRAYLDRQPYFQDMPRFLVHETAVHWIDTFRFLLGDAHSVYADLRRLNPAIVGEDAGYILFEHAGGVRALFDGNRHLDHASDNPRRTMGEALFEGTTGTLSLFGDGRVELRQFGETSSTIVFPADMREGFGGDCVYALQAHVVRALQTGEQPENTARDYCTVLKVRDAIYTSAETGAKVAV